MNTIYIDGLSSRVRTALKENGELTEIIYESESDFNVGNIYVGRVAKVLKGQFIFIDIGDEKNAFLQPDEKKEPAIYDEKGKIKLKEGDSVLVQLVKSAVDEKGAVVTTRLNFTGKYCVAIANDSGIGVSKKISDEEKRAELKALAGELVPNGYGFIMRTDCESVSCEVVREDLAKLIKKASEVISRSAYIKPPYLIYEELSETSRIVRDLAMGKDTEVITNSKAVAEKLTSELGNISVKLYTETVPMFSNYSIESGIEKALHRKIWLKSGGYIVIDYTEAMNVIDVNSGKHTGKNLKDFALKVNLEAAEEIARQIRLRNLTGMIIVDFIDMHNKEDIQKVSQRLKECIARDRVTTALVGMTELGLMQLTRKKTRLPLHKLIMRDCPVCGGTGLTENEFYAVDKVLTELTATLTQTIYKKITVKGGAAMIAALKRISEKTAELERQFDAQIRLEEISTGKLYYYELVREV
jgi:ribonuclease G